jgi:membrane-associated phospholipid phosphatase
MKINNDYIKDFIKSYMSLSENNNMKELPGFAFDAPIVGFSRGGDELYDFYKVSPKKKGGMSFPSRHAYSAFAIGTALCFESPLLGGILLLFSVLMCFARVLLGIHFLRDVLTGALVGTLSVLIGTFIFSLV